jgi:hypothetical protein
MKKKYIVPFSSEVLSSVCYPKIRRLKHRKLRIIFPVVLYGRETWSLTLREEYKLMVFENWVPEENISAKEG